MRNGFARAASSITALASVIAFGVAHPAQAAGATGGYRMVSLTSNVPGQGRHSDANLVNPWGLAYFTDSPFWVSDQVTGLSTLYDNTGNPQGLVVTIPAAPEQPNGTTGSPTGLIANPTSHFVVTENGKSGPAFFIYSTLDGTISGWNPSVDLNHAVVAVDNFSHHSLYTGLAFSKTAAGPWLWAADAANNKVDVFGDDFSYLFSLTAPHVPKGLSAYGVQIVNGTVIVTYANPHPNTGGAVALFGIFGQFLGMFSSNGPGGPLEAPWAVVRATKQFGQFSGDLLIGNVDNGHISAFDPKSGKFLGQLRNGKGAVIAIPGLWGLSFGSGGGVSGNPNELYFTAGTAGYADGLFGKIVPIQ